MKIFKMFTTTICTITLLATASHCFGMNQDPNAGKKPKKTFGPDLPTTNVPTDVEKHRQACRQSRSIESLKFSDELLQTACLPHITH